MICTSLRFADGLCVKPWTMKLDQASVEGIPVFMIKGLCWKSKADQTGKRGQLSCPDFYLEKPWLKQFFSLYMNCANADADFFLPWLDVTRDHRVEVDMSRPAEYSPSQAASKAIFRNLASEQDKLHLLPKIEPHA